MTVCLGSRTVARLKNSSVKGGISEVSISLSVIVSMRAQSVVGLILPLTPLKSHRCSIAGEGEKDKPVRWMKLSDKPAHIWLDHELSLGLHRRHCMLHMVAQQHRMRSQSLGDHKTYSPGNFNCYRQHIVQHSCYILSSLS